MSAVLPYPDLDFVPLDILTAAEMNQLVANERYLANFWTSADSNSVIESNHIKDNAVLTRHVNFQEFPKVSFSGRQLSFTIPSDGVYSISCGVLFGANNKQGEYSLSIYLNNTRIDGCSILPYSNFWWVPLQTNTVVKSLRANDVVTASCSVPASDVTIHANSGLFISRIL